jgi:hypothetical protein
VRNLSVLGSPKFTYVIAQRILYVIAMEAKIEP